MESSSQIFSTVNSYSNPCRFCYSYVPPGIVNTCCQPVICNTSEYLSSISSLQLVTYNSVQTSERSMLLQSQQQYLQEIYTVNNNIIIQNTIANSTSITSTMYAQLLQVRQQRYQPYQPYVPPFIPSSLIQFQMNTINVGVPHSFFTYKDCKGSQSVTT